MAYQRGYYKGTEITAQNRIEYKANFYDLQIKYDNLEKEIQEIDLLIAQYQNKKERLESLKQAFVSTPPPKQKSIQPKSA